MIAANTPKKKNDIRQPVSKTQLAPCREPTT